MLRFGALVAIATVACSASAADAAYPGQNGRIVFVESAEGRGGAGWAETIVSVREDGTDRRALTRPTSGSADFDPAWSPDGRRIAYVHSSGREVGHHTAGSEIWLMDADGGRKRRLTRNSVFDGSPTWSPDSRRILFVRGRLLVGPGQRQAADLWVMNGDGTGQRRLRRTAELELEPAWAPRGDLIAYVIVPPRACRSQRCSVGLQRDLWVANADGGLARPAGVGGDLRPTAPTWSPDAARLAVATTRGIVTLSADGTGVRVLGGGADPAYAPDGSLLVVAEQWGLTRFLGLALLGLDGRARALTRDPAPTAELLVDHTQPDWQPVRR
jgi:Tol biopolymer transport system component